MKPLLTKHFLIVSTLAATLSLSACGDKKNVTVGGPVPAAADEDRREGSSDSKDSQGDLKDLLCEEEIEVEVDEEPAPKRPAKTQAESEDLVKLEKLKVAETPIVPKETLATDNLWLNDEFGANLPDPFSPVAAPAPKAPPVEKKPVTPPPPTKVVEEPKAKKKKVKKIVKVKCPEAPTNTPAVPHPAKSVTNAPGVARQLERQHGGSNYHRYVYNDEKNVLEENYPKNLTGAATHQGYVYTSSAYDSLIDSLRARNDRASAENRRLNLEASAAVESAKIAMGRNNRDLVLTVRIHEGRQLVTYNLVGRKNGVLSKVPMANGERTTGFRDIEATATCMDADGNCQILFARIKIGQSPQAGIINIVFRNTNADLFFKLPGKNSGNPDYLKLREMAYNTIQKNPSANRVKQLRFASYEVVHGKSGFGVMIKTLHGELLAFSGSLLAPEYGTRLQLPLNRGDKHKDDMLDTVMTGQSHFRYAQSLVQAMMIGNNGLGQIEIELSLKQRPGYYADSFSLVFMRAPIMIKSLD